MYHADHECSARSRRDAKRSSRDRAWPKRGTASTGSFDPTRACSSKEEANLDSRCQVFLTPVSAARFSPNSGVCVWLATAEGDISPPHLRGHGVHLAGVSRERPFMNATWIALRFHVRVEPAADVLFLAACQADCAVCGNTVLQYRCLIGNGVKA